MKCGILTLSDKGAKGEREDTSGPLIRDMLTDLKAEILVYEIIADQKVMIADKLTAWSDNLHLDLIITTGGTGVSPSDVTPEATKAIIDREVPGLAEAMRAKSLQITPHAMLSRGICGIRGKTLIINLPGSRKAAKENLETVLPTLAHAVDKINGSTEDCAPP